MTILSRTGLKAAFIAFGRDILASLMLVFGLMFIPVKALASCEDDLSASLLALSKYVDVPRLSTLSKTEANSRMAQMISLNKTLAERKEALSSQRAKLLAPIRQEEVTLALEKKLGVPQINAQINTLEEDIRGVQRYISLLKRISAAGYKNPSTDVLQAKVAVEGKSQVEVMKAIRESLSPLKQDLVLRFIPIARQDILLEHGIDNFGREHGNTESWDMFDLEAQLQERGLKAYDGFYALTLDEVAAMGPAVNGIEQPFAMVSDFALGDRALAVYDGAQLEMGEGDFYFFNDPSRRKKALIALILPVKQR